MPKKKKNCPLGHYCKHCNEYMATEKISDKGPCYAHLQGSVKSFSQNSKQVLWERSQPAIDAPSRLASKCFIFMYLLLPH